MKRFLSIGCLILMSFVLSSYDVADVQNVESSDTVVWICTGPKSECYHKHFGCRGLNSCSGEIKKVTISTAQQMHRRQCKICY